MKLPAFFDQVPRLRLVDPLADFLGAAEDGVLEYGYADAVRLAGHSCPTVASAYWLSHRALAELYPDSLPVRGQIRVSFREAQDQGVTGVVAAVVGLLTGAAHDGGFKGLAGQFARNGLQRFAAKQPLSLRFSRSDSGASVDAMADLSHVPGDPAMAQLLSWCLSGQADADERRRFATLWQARVASILLNHADDPEVFVIRPVSS